MSELAQIKRGLAWFGSATLLTKLFDIAGIFVVLRCLDSEQIGLASLALGASIIFESFGGLGVEAAIVQARQLSASALSSLFWFCVIVAVVISGSVLATASSIAAFYDEPRLVPLLWASTVKFLALGATIVPFQLLIRNLHFREVSFVQGAASVGVNAAKISLALGGMGAWALVIPNVLHGVLSLVVTSCIAPFRPRLHFVWSEIREFVSFGVRAAASTILMQCSRNLDNLLVGKFLGMSALGVYRVAFDIAMMPMEILSQTTYRVAYPVFSRVADQWKQLESTFFDTSRMLLVMTGPLAVLIFFGARDLLQLIAGEKWLDAVPAIRILCWAGVLRSTERLFTRLFNAIGKPQLTLIETVATLAILGISMGSLLAVYGETLGVITVCIAWIVSYPLLFLVVQSLVRTVMPLRFAAYARHLAPTVLCVAIMAAAAALATALRPDAWPVTGMAIVIGAGLGSYILSLRWIAGFRLREAFK